jgi:hypothetical protein
VLPSEVGPVFLFPVRRPTPLGAPESLPRLVSVSAERTSLLVQISPVAVTPVTAGPGLRHPEFRVTLSRPL